MVDMIPIQYDHDYAVLFVNTERSLSAKDCGAFLFSFLSWAGGDPREGKVVPASARAKADGRALDIQTRKAPASFFFCSPVSCPFVGDLVHHAMAAQLSVYSRGPTALRRRCTQYNSEDLQADWLSQMPSSG